MPWFRTVPIMPKESRPRMSGYTTASAPYPKPTSSVPAPRNAATWSAADDEILLQARASGLNWQPIAGKHFPHKSANACRKRHERLKGIRDVEDWDARKLERLAVEYESVRREMWEVLAVRLGESWKTVEAKCMEKGLKTLHATARSAQRRGSAAAAVSRDSFDEQGIADHLSDSGVGMGSDAEMEVDDADSSKNKPATWHAAPPPPTQQQHSHHHHQQQPDPSKPRTLPQPLPLYRPPPLTTSLRRTFDVDVPITTSPATMSYMRHSSSQRVSPDSQNSRGGMSIQSVLSPIEPQGV